jgi:hypothetical protein
VSALARPEGFQLLLSAFGVDKLIDLRLLRLGQLGIDLKEQLLLALGLRGDSPRIQIAKRW